MPLYGRTAQILAALQLAPYQLDREKLQGQLAAQQSGQVADLVKSALGYVPQGLDAMKQSADADAMRAAQEDIASNATSRGTEIAGPHQPGEAPSYSDTPEDVTSAALGKDTRLAGPQKSGSAVEDFFNDPFGYKAQAAAKARLAAQQGITANVVKNRDTARAQSIQQQEIAQKANVDAADIAAKNAATGASVAQTEDVKTKAARDAAAFEKSQTDDAVKQAVAAGIARGDSPGWIRVKNPDLEDGDIATEYARQTGNTAAQSAGLDEKKAQTANLYAEAGLKGAEAKAKASAGQGKFASALSDIDSGVALVDDLKRRAQNVVGTRQGISGTLQDVGSDMHGVTGALLKGVGRAAQTPDMAAFNTDLTNFVLHSSKALEGTHRSISEGQAKEIRDRLLADAHSGDLNSLNAELDALRAAMVAERANIGRTGIATPTGDAGTSSTLPNPFR